MAIRHATPDEARRFERLLEAMSDFFFMDDPGSAFARVVKDVMEVFPDCVIVGGVALSYHVKNRRLTEDVDIVLLNTSFTGLAGERFEMVEDKPSTLRHKETGIKVDVLTPDHPTVNRELVNIVPVHVQIIEQAGTRIRVASPAMVIGLKLPRAIHESRKGLQDRLDIISILDDNPDLELDPIRAHLSKEEKDMLNELIEYGEKLTDDR